MGAGGGGGGGRGGRGGWQRQKSLRGVRRNGGVRMEWCREAAREKAREIEKARERIYIYMLGLLDYGKNHNHDYFGQY